MFLKEMNIREKSAFYFIVKKLIAADGVLDDNEKSMLGQFLVEMDVKLGKLIQVDDIEEACGLLDSSDMSIKKKLYLELTGLACCDGEYADSEKAYLHDISEKLGIERSNASEIEKCVIDLLDVYKRIDMLTQA